MKIGCLIYFYGKKYESLGKVALNSFRVHHPEIDIIHVDDENVKDFSAFQFRESIGGGLFKYLLAAELMKTKKYDKMIVLGADTITCSRLDAFLDDNKSDIIATQDYPYQVGLPIVFYPKTMGENPAAMVVFSPIIVSKQSTLQFATCFESANDVYKYCQDPSHELGGYKIIDHLHFNADVVCFNNLNALQKLIEISIIYRDTHHLFLESASRANFPETGKFAGLKGDYYAEQGALNILCSLSMDPRHKDYNFSIGIAGDPYCFGDSVYNVRSKGNRNLCDDNDSTELKSEIKPWGSFIKKWSIESDKLFDCNGRQIKVFHYCDAFGQIDNELFCKIINKYIFEWFNKETKQFFREQCDCGDFFEKRFTL